MLSRLGSFTSRFLFADLHGFDFDAFCHFPQMVRVARKSHQAFGEKNHNSSFHFAQKTKMLDQLPILTEGGKKFASHCSLYFRFPRFFTSIFSPMWDQNKRLDFGY